VILVLGAEAYPDVRQSSFELLGDLAIQCAAHLVPKAADILVLVAHNMSAEVASQPHNLSACNNACWAAGELVVRMGAEPNLPAQLWPYVGPLVEVRRHLQPTTTKKGKPERSRSSNRSPRRSPLRHTTRRIRLSCSLGPCAHAEALCF
jgi:hypothetical protein